MTIKINSAQKKSEIQKIVIDEWYDNDCKGIFLGGTGLGKTKVLVEICKLQFKEKPGSTILIGVPTRRLRDATIKEEFLKWDAEDVFNKLRIECYDTIRNWTDTNWDLILLDEFDKILTPMRFNFLLNNSYNRILGVTATLEGAEKQRLASQVGPIIYRYSTDTAAKDGLVNKSVNIVVRYKLNNLSKNVIVEYKSKSEGMKRFYTTEKANYDYHNNIFIESREKLELLGYTSLGNNAYTLIKNPLVPPEHKKLIGKYVRAMKSRKDLLMALPSAVKISKRLITGINENKAKFSEYINHELPENPKILVFSEVTKHVDEITHNTVHSNKAKKKKENDILSMEAINKFNSGEETVLGACQAINVGENLVGANIGIFASYYSSETNGQQRRGRLKRLDTQDIAFNFFLVAVDTQMEVWFNNMTKEMNKDEFIYIDFKHK